jgi:hypothetical protein
MKFLLAQWPTVGAVWIALNLLRLLRLIQERPTTHCRIIRLFLNMCEDLERMWQWLNFLYCPDISLKGFALRQALHNSLRYHPDDYVFTK